MAQESGLIPNPQPITIDDKLNAPQIMFARLITARRFYRRQRMAILHCRCMRQSQTFSYVT